MPRGWNTLCLLSEAMRDLDQLFSTQTYRHCADMMDSLSWLVLEHFREYNQWPWQSFNSLEQQLAHHPSFVFAEFLFVLLSGFAFLHAACESYAKEERRLLLIWVATFIVGTVNDYIFMLLPVVDNFWQAQGLIMLTPRMPPCTSPVCTTASCIGRLLPQPEFSGRGTAHWRKQALQVY